MDEKDVSYKEVIDQISDGLYVVDRARRILSWNRGAEAISGFDREQVAGAFCYDNILQHIDGEGRSLCHSACPLVRTMRDGVSRDELVYLHHREGHRVPVQVRTSPVLDREGQIVGAVEVFSDATPTGMADAQLEELKRAAMTDALTELPNRRYLEMTLGSALHELRHAERDFGLLMIDIDHFKSVNDTHGHATGDEMLRLVSRTLRHAARGSDDLGRWGGEEFLAILRCSPEQLAGVAERFRTMVATSQLRDRTPPLGVTISIGGAAARPDDTAETLLERADARLYEAKAAGRNRCTTTETKT